MHLHELLGWRGPMTHRQWIGWLLWEREDMNNPSRTDRYIMLAAHSARHAFHSQPPEFSEGNYRLKFDFAVPEAEKAAQVATNSPQEPIEDDGWERYDQVNDPRLRVPPVVTDEVRLKVDKADRRWQMERSAQAQAALRKQREGRRPDGR